MTSDWNRIIEPNRLYRPKELGGKGKNAGGLLAMKYDSVIRKIVNKYHGVIAPRNKDGNYRSPILVPGWVVIQWLEDNSR